MKAFYIYVAAIALACASIAQNYSINWHTVGGGGGTSTGKVYSVSGTIGQPATGKAQGGNYVIEGGFWAAAVAVQTPGAPLLTIQASGPGRAAISWSPQTPGFVLQESPSVSPPSWTNSVSGATNPIVVPAGFPVRYYRLYKP